MPTAVPLYPDFTQTCFSSLHTITVFYSLKSKGTLYCRAFELPHSNISTIRAISDPGVSSTSVVHFGAASGNLTLGGLKGDMNYEVLCYGASFIQFPGLYYGTEIPVVYEKSCQIKTPCCKSITLHTTEEMAIVEKGVVSGAIMVSLSSFPSSNLTLTPYVYWTPFSGNQCNNSLDPLMLSSREIQIVPSTLIFTSESPISSQSLNRLIHVNSSFPYTGCLYLSLDVGGGSASEFETVASTSYSIYSGLESPSYHVDDTVVLAMVTTDGIPAAPEIQSISVDTNTGLTHVYFYFSTDEGISINLTQAPRSPFLCSKLLNFSSSESSFCSFVTARDLVILPSERIVSSFPHVSDSVSLVEGCLKTFCPLDKHMLCESYPFNSRQDLILSSEDFIRNYVEINLLGSNFITDFDQHLHFDLTSSTGHGNRPWKSINWVVYQPDYRSRNLLAEEYMNDQLDWFSCYPKTVGCDLLPLSFLDHYGLYTFVVRLENYVGSTSFVSLSVEYLHLDEQSRSTPLSVYNTIPWIVMTNRMSDIQWARLPSTVQGDLRFSHLFPSNPIPSKTLLDWEVYLDRQLDDPISLLNLAKDPRKHTVSPHSLKPSHEYIFRFTVSPKQTEFSSRNLFNSTYSAFSPVGETRIYIPEGQIRAVVKRGVFQTVSRLLDFNVDGSPSFDEDSTNTSHLRYSWSCTQLFPVLSEDCGGVDLSSLGSSVVRISSHDLTEPRVYKFLLTVSDWGGSRQDTTVVVISMTDANPFSVFIADTVLKDKTSDSFFTVDSIVTYDRGYSLKWLLVERRIEYLQLTFPSGSNFFPCKLATSLIGSSIEAHHTLQLSLSAENSPPMIYEISIHQNSPPIGGVLELYSPQDVFSDPNLRLVALYWSDIDLPLGYSFHQSLIFPNQSQSFQVLLRQRSRLSWASTTPSLLDGRSEVEVSLKVFDSLDCFSELTSQIDMMVNETSSLQILNSQISLAINDSNLDFVLQLSSQKYVDLKNPASNVCENVTSPQCLSELKFDLGTLSWLLTNLNFDEDVFSTLQTFYQTLANEVSKGASLSALTVREYVENEVVMFDLCQELVSLISDLSTNSDSLNPILSDLLATLDEISTAFFPLVSNASSTQGGGGDDLNMTSSSSTMTSRAIARSRSLQSSGSLPDPIEIISTSVSAIVQILYDGTSLGESLSISLDYYSIFMTKSWPSLISCNNLPVTAVDSIDLSAVLLQNNTLSAIALGVMSITLEDKDISNCVSLNSTCHVPTPSLSSTIFVTSPPFFGDDEYSSTYVLSNPFTRGDLSTEAETPKVLECLNSSMVHLDCSNSTRFGYIFETDLTCPGQSDVFVLDRWETTCPVYRTTAECVSPCKYMELVPGQTTCECDQLVFSLDLTQNVGGDVAKSANYETFRSKSLLSIVYSIDVEIYPELTYIAPEVTASPTSSNAEIREIVRNKPIHRDAWYLLPLILGLCCLFAMFLLLFCRKPRTDEWLQINNSHPCLRSAVRVYDEKFLDTEKVSRNSHY
jgi:hypothetical protein